MGKMIIPLSKLKYEIKIGNKIVADTTLKNLLARCFSNDKSKTN